MAEKMTEIRWHGRGGQGAKTAATLVAMVALEEGKYSQGFPEYGPERMGAPIRAFNRISLEPVRMSTAVRSPSIVIVLDDSLLDTVDVTEGSSDETIFLINTARQPTDATRDAFRSRIGGKGAIFIVDANRVAVETIGRPIPNTPMVGAMLRATKILPMETVVAGIEHKLGKKFPPKVVEGNVRAMKRAYEEVCQL